MQIIIFSVIFFCPLYISLTVRATKNKSVDVHSLPSFDPLSDNENQRIKAGSQSSNLREEKVYLPADHHARWNYQSSKGVEDLRTSGGQEANLKAHKFQKIKLPARKVCVKGFYDAEVDACSWYDKLDKVSPIFECPPGSVLQRDYCIGRIISDFELKCPRNFNANLEDQCVKAIVYQPVAKACPEGFEGKLIPRQPGVRQCVRTQYAEPIQRPIITKEIFMASKHQKGNEQKNIEGIDFVFECPDNGQLVNQKDSKKAVCKIEVVVPPENRNDCITGYRWTLLDQYGGACVHIAALDAKKVCPHPNPRIGPGVGDWETPWYKFHPRDRCVAYKAKPLISHCPEGYELEGDSCVRKYLLPYFMDCNNVEGFAFYWYESEKKGVCEYEFDLFKWSKGANYITQKEKFDSNRLYFLSNPFQVKRAAETAQFSTPIA